MVPCQILPDDAKSTYNLYQHLTEKLSKVPWIKDLKMYDYYQLHMRPFGQLLTDLERRGMLIAKNYLADVEGQAREDRQRHVETFRQWAYERIGPDGLAMNLASSVQLTTFLFGGAENVKTKEKTETERIFKTAREDIPDDAIEAYRERDAQSKEELTKNGVNAEQDCEGSSSQSQRGIESDEFDQMKAAQLKELCKAYGLKVSGKKSDLQQRLRGHFLSTDVVTSANTIADDYDLMSLEDLRDACNARGLSPKGKKASLMKELRKDDSYAREILAETTINSNEDSSLVYRQISQTLEEAIVRGGNDALKDILAAMKAKNEEEPKYVDVKITSLGMTPEKFTESGAPSVTADVLKKLAGDPFANPPKYGKVSYLCIFDTCNLF